eukprot:Pgem_evm1s1847
MWIYGDLINNMLMINEDLTINDEIKNGKDNGDEYIISDDDSEGDDKDEWIPVLKSKKDERERESCYSTMVC